MSQFIQQILPRHQVLGAAGDTAGTETAPGLPSWGSQASARDESVPVSGDPDGQGWDGGVQ